MSDLFSNLAERVQGGIPALRPLHSFYRPEAAPIGPATGINPGLEPGISENRTESPRIDSPAIPGRIPLAPVRNRLNEQQPDDVSASGTVGDRETPRAVSDLQRFNERQAAHTETSDIAAVPLRRIANSVPPAPQSEIADHGHRQLQIEDAVPDVMAQLDPTAVTRQRLPLQLGEDVSQPLSARRSDDFTAPKQPEGVPTPLTPQASHQVAQSLDDAARSLGRSGSAMEPLVWDQTARAAVSLPVNPAPHNKAVTRAKAEGNARRVNSAPDQFGMPLPTRDFYQSLQVAPSVIEKEERHVTISIGRLEVRVNSISGLKPAVTPARSGSALSEYLRERQAGGR